MKFGQFGIGENHASNGASGTPPTWMTNGRKTLPVIDIHSRHVVHCVSEGVTDIGIPFLRSNMTCSDWWWLRGASISSTFQQSSGSVPESRHICSTPWNHTFIISELLAETRSISRACSCLDRSSGRRCMKVATQFSPTGSAAVSFDVTIKFATTRSSV